MQITTKPISIQCEATRCIYNSAGTCNYAIKTGVVEISENENNSSAFCVNYTDNSKSE